MWGVEDGSSCLSEGAGRGIVVVLEGREGRGAGVVVHARVRMVRWGSGSWASERRGREAERGAGEGMPSCSSREG